LFDTPHYKSVRLIPFLLLSCMLHSAVLLVLPDLTRLFNIHIRRLVPLAQIELEVALIKPEPVPEPKPEPKSGVTQNQPPRLLDKHIAFLIDVRLQALPALGDAAAAPPAPVELPSVAALTEFTTTVLPIPETDPAARPQKLLGKLGRQSQGRLSGRRLGGVQDEPEADDKLTRLLVADVKQALSNYKEVEKKVVDRDYSLSGPVAVDRQVLFRPQLPKVTLVRDVTVSFRFWVRPDGNVSRIETRRIGDLKLVNVAERYLKQWRFSRLSSEAEQQEQWGTVSITFRVPR